MAPKPTRKPTRKPPDSLGKPGKKFWKSTLDAYVFDSDHHYELLSHACRMLDMATLAREAITKSGLLTPDRFGVLKESPAVASERQSMNAFRIACRELALDLEDGPTESRGPRRPGTRN